MSKRPEHATDCPGCDTGWTTGDLLCPLCAQAVCVSEPELFDKWLKARGILDAVGTDTPPRPYTPEVCVATEAFRRGLIVGTARVLSAQRAAQHAAWKERKAQRRTRK